MNLLNAVEKHGPKKVIVVTHIPPFKEACLYEGKVTSDDFLPFFASKATGNGLIKAAKENRGIEFLVLCGHTHDQAHWQPLDNLTVKVGSAEYMEPKIQETINF